MRKPLAALSVRAWRREAAALVALFVALTLGPATDAWAFGNPVLDRLIVASPGAGWRPASSNSLKASVAFENRVMGLLPQYVGSAARSWKQGTRSLAVLLSGFSIDLGVMAKDVGPGVIRGCSALTGNSPDWLRPYRPIAGAYEAECTARAPTLLSVHLRVSSGYKAAGLGNSTDGPTVHLFMIVWGEADVIAFVMGTGVPSAEVGNLALAEHKSVPVHGVAWPPPGSPGGP